MQNNGSDIRKGILKDPQHDQDDMVVTESSESKKGIKWDEENLTITEAQRGQWTQKVTEPKTPYIHYNADQDVVTGYSGQMAPMELTSAAIAASSTQVSLKDLLPEGAQSDTLFSQLNDSSSSKKHIHGVLKDVSHRRTSSKSSIASGSSHSKSVRLSSAEDDDIINPANGEWDSDDDADVQLAPEGHVHQPVHDADINLSELSPEERVHREAFAKKRQEHYKMKGAILRKKTPMDTEMSDE